MCVCVCVCVCVYVFVLCCSLALFGASEHLLTWKSATEKKIFFFFLNFRAHSLFVMLKWTLSTSVIKIKYAPQQSIAAVSTCE